MGGGRPHPLTDSSAQTTKPLGTKPPSARDGLRYCVAGVLCAVSSAMPPKGKGKRAADDNSLAPLSTLLARASRATLEELLQKYHDEGHVNVRVDLSSRLAPEQARATRPRFSSSALTVTAQRKKVHEGHRVKADASLVPDGPFSVRGPPLCPPC